MAAESTQHLGMARAPVRRHQSPARSGESTSANAWDCSKPGMASIEGLRHNAEPSDVWSEEPRCVHPGQCPTGSWLVHYPGWQPEAVVRFRNETIFLCRVSQAEAEVAELEEIARKGRNTDSEIALKVWSLGRRHLETFDNPTSLRLLAQTKMHALSSKETDAIVERISNRLDAVLHASYQRRDTANPHPPGPILPIFRNAKDVGGH